MRIVAAVAALLLSQSGNSVQPTATLAVIDARVWTGNPAQPWAEAIAIDGERILAVGSTARIRSLCSASTRVIDGGGGLLTPGFIDSHIHLYSFDRSPLLPPIFMRFLRTRAEAADRISAYASKLPKGSWILGEDWTDRLWGRGLPTRDWLDSLAPDHPVWLTNGDGDAGIANSAALKAAGITRVTPDEPPGIIERDARHEPTGVIRGGPMWRITRAIVEPTRARDDRLIEEAMARLARAGVTSVQHNNSWYEMMMLQRLHQAGKLRVRVYATPSLPGWRRLRDYIAAHGRGDSWLHWGALKGFGAILEPEYYRWISGATGAGLQVMVHVGDEKGLRTLLGIYERVRLEQNPPDPRFRVEHSHDMPADVIPTLARNNIIVSWQPPLLLHVDQRTKAGQPPPGNLFPCRALLRAGVKIAFGTDDNAPRGIVTPLESLALALERTASDGTRISFDQALAAYTRDAAYAEFAEREKGTLEAGKWSDMVLFDRDFSAEPLRAIRSARVRLTIVGGLITYQE